jgi:tetratricopeptide (TPR) repeat protein
MPTRSDIINGLQKGLTQDKKYKEGESLENQYITEVSNINDAILLSKSKQMPIMAIIFSKESKWSQKIIDESLVNPLVQSELKNVILVKIDQAGNRSLLKQWSISYFPTTMFLNDEGEIIYQVQGFQPAKALANLIASMKLILLPDNRFKDRITWLYSLEEAKFFATVQKKDIFVFVNADWCPFCQQMIHVVYKDPAVVKTLNDQFVSLEIDQIRDADVISALGISGFPTLMILDNKQSEILRTTGYAGQGELLDMLNLEERKPVYSILGYDKYKQFYSYENAADHFIYLKYYRSAIHILQKQIDIYSDYWKSYYLIGEAYGRLNEADKMLSYYMTAFEKGAEINQDFTNSILRAYLELKDSDGFKQWIQKAINSRADNADEVAVLYLTASEFYEIMQDQKTALEMAERSVSAKTDNAEGYIRLGRLQYLQNSFNKANENLNKAARIKADDPRPYFYLGLISDRNSDWIAKEKYFKQAREKNAASDLKIGWRINYQSRFAYYEYEGYLALIEQGYRESLTLDDDAQVKNSLAYFFAEENRNLDEALQLVNAALRENADDPNFLDTKALILYRQTDFQGAQNMLSKYEKTIKIENLDAYSDYSYYIGRIKWAVGDTLAAKTYFNHAMKNSTPDVAGKRAQEKLRIFMQEKGIRL